MCGSGLATAQWGKADLMVTVSEGSGVAGEGFIVRVDTITADCAVRVSTADPTRLFEVMADSYAGGRLNLAGLIATADGGATWSCVRGLPSEDVVSVWFADPSHGWVTTRSDLFGSASGGGARVWRTDDGGRTWRSSLA